VPIPTFTGTPSFTYDIVDALPTGVKALGVKLPLTAELGYNVESNLAFGVDSVFLNKLVPEALIAKAGGTPSRSYGGWWQTLFDSIYMMDKHDVNGVMTDLPEFKAELDLMATAGLGFGSKTGLAYVGGELGVGAGLDFAVDLVTDDPDGKLRLGKTLWDAVANPASLLNIFDVDLDIGLLLKAAFLAQLNTDPKDGLELSDPVVSALAKGYNAAADLFSWPKEFKWDPSTQLPIELLSFDWGAKNLKLIGQYDYPLTV
jgi:hypothetical protein